jgi:hypothetical protein
VGGAKDTEVAASHEGFRDQTVRRFEVSALHPNKVLVILSNSWDKAPRENRSKTQRSFHNRALKTQIIFDNLSGQKIKHQSQFLRSILGSKKNSSKHTVSS